MCNNKRINHSTMKKLLLILALLISSNANAQFLKDVYKDFLKYGTFYAAGNIENAQAVQPNYFIRTNPDDFYDTIHLIIDMV